MSLSKLLLNLTSHFKKLLFWSIPIIIRLFLSRISNITLLILILLLILVGNIGIFTQNVNLWCLLLMLLSVHWLLLKLTWGLLFSCEISTWEYFLHRTLFFILILIITLPPNLVILLIILEGLVHLHLRVIILWNIFFLIPTIK